jgi:hypothetical protein
MHATNFRSFPRKRESRSHKYRRNGLLPWVPAFHLRAVRFGGLKPAKAREASVGWVAGTSGA